MRVVIIGAGFGGLRLARKLNNKPGFDEVYLIDRYNYHQFQPLFYQVATAALEPSNISFPLRKAFHGSKNVRVRVDELKRLVPSESKVVLENEEISYDFLVLATGADTNFFGNQQAQQCSFPMKSTVEAIQLRHRLIQNFEDALHAKDAHQLEKLFNIVVVGGGATGVEVAGALAEMKRYVLPKDYPELDFTKMNIYLLEGGDRVLPPMSPKSSEDAAKYLEQLGVTVMVNSLLKTYDGDLVTLADGGTIASSLVIWAAGIKGNVPEGIDKTLVVRGNRIKVDRYNRVHGFDNIFAIGDLAYMETPKFPNGQPQVAPVAIQHADNLADYFRRLERKSTRFYEFEYNDKGAMATIGRNKAVVDMPKPKLHIRGFLAWLIWMGLHLFLILGVKNRLFVFMNWVYNYFTYDQSLRLIFKVFNRPKLPVDTTKQAQANPHQQPQAV